MRQRFDREKIAFLATVLFGAIFLVVGSFFGTDSVYGYQTTSLTVTTTITATINSVIVIYASDAVAIPAIIPGNSTPGDASGFVSVETNNVKGYKIYNYMDYYLTRSDLGGPGDTITNDPAGPPTAPTPWTAGTDYGLGFSLSGPTNDAKWHNGNGYFNYASFTTTAAGAQAVNNYQTWSSGLDGSLTVVYVLDAPSSIADGSYKGYVNWFAITNI